MASPYKTTEYTMQDLKSQDSGPDLSNGDLVYEKWAYEDDGTPYVERLYMQNLIYKSSRSKHYTKTKSYGATGSVQVEADFSWNTSTKKVTVSNVSGRFNRGGGISGTRNAKTSKSGNGTSKASASYSIEVNRNLGGWATYKVTLYCNYNGKTS